MRLAGGFVFLLCVHLFLIPPDGALSAPGGGGERCRRQCGGLVVPYPLGFSGSCPILLACVDAGNSTAALILPGGGGGGNATTTTSSYSYTASNFNASRSTFVVALPPSCSRTVSEARRWLSGANYGVSSRTGLFLRGDCHRNSSASNATNCSIPAETMSRMVPTASCGAEGNTTASALTCVTSTSPAPDPAKPESSSGSGIVGLFAEWKKLEEPSCDNLLTSVYGDTREGVFSLEFSVAEMGWWVNGNCTHGGGGGDLAWRCAPNATCLNVQTPTGGWGHQCKCLHGMVGDGFAAGEGCYFAATATPGPFKHVNIYAPANSFPFRSPAELAKLKMHLAGGRLLLLLCVGVQFLLILPYGALSASPAAAATGGDERCRRKCGGLDVPYPFGFSGDCPILLACDEGNSTAALLRPTNGTSTTMEPLSYAVVGKSFNSTASTFVVSLLPSCNRTVSDARLWLTGANYGVSSSTGLFVRGCQNAKNNSCSVPAEAMSSMLTTAKCGGGGGGGNGTASSPVTCIPTMSTEADMAKGVGLFAQWDKVEEPRCDNLLTSVYGETTNDGVFTLEIAVAEMGWWVNGNCSNHSAAAADLVGLCAANATCHDVRTPSGAWGHQCRCLEGMDGDGFAAGEGCHFPGVLAGTVAAGVLFLCCARCRRSGGGGGRSGFDRLAAKRLLSEAASSSGVPVYSYHEVARATNSFSHTHRLGTGAYGTVYVGKLPASSPSLVAIKRMRRRHDDGDDDAAVAVLLNEVKLISSLSHPGLVRLLGCCLDRGEQILVYEFVPNGTLAHHLAGGGLPWRARLGVAAETAAGHAGNFHLSDKSDVYSFGVVLLELITAMKVVDFARPAAEVNLASLALDRIGKGRVDDIVDPALVDRADEWVMRSVRHVSELAFRCLAFQKDVRPAMSEVAAELARIRDAAPASVPGARTGAGSRPPMVIDVGVGFDGVDAAVKKVGSPVSVQDVWVSDQSSPSTNGSMPRFA
uniref:Protein kinase domain-containing protein n=1 Tax=Oryza nivara TaxID=4536 RepID=A0A0E0JBY0_ORYNI